jgi:hypothetical protein
MPYNSFVEFQKQLASLAQPVPNGPALHQQFVLRPLQHVYWNDFDTYTLAGAALLPAIPQWIVQNNAGLHSIQTAGLPQELLDGLQNYGAMAESVRTQPNPPFRGSAGAAVLFDTITDRLYYATSIWRPGLVVHASLTTREHTLPVINSNNGPLHTHIPTRSVTACAEFQALNEALLDGAQEANLHIWCFRVREMRPFPRCQNCQVTVPSNALGKIWTG